MEIAADPPAQQQKKKDEDLSSILLLIWKEKENKMKNTWAMVENLNSASAPKISECGGISLDLPGEDLVQPQCVLVGPHLYCIGGAIMDESGRKRTSASNKVFQFDINQPSKGWKICHQLPFFCPDIQVAVSGDLVYIFPKGRCFHNSPSNPSPKCITENWAYIFDTKDTSLSRFLNCPEPECPYCVIVDVCASMDHVAGVCRGVMVYLSYGDAWFHDPVQNSWKTYKDFGNNSPEAVIPDSDIMPAVYASTVSNGILYIFRVGHHFVQVGSHSVEQVPKPVLSAYDIAQGKLLFRDLSFKGPHPRSGSHFSNFLFPVGDCKLCWLEIFSGMAIVAYTIISVCYDATSPTCLRVDKAGYLDDVQFKFLPACLAIDSFCWDRIKRLPQVAKEDSFMIGPYKGPPGLGYAMEYRPQPKPKTSILMLIWRMERNNLESGWAIIKNLDSSTDSPQIIECSRSSLVLPEESKKRLSPPHSLLVGSHLYSIHSVMDRDSKKQDSYKKVLRYDIPSGCWNDFYCLPFFSKNIMTAVSGDLIYIFPPPGMTSLHAKDSRPAILPIEWAYIIDTKERKGRYIPFPSPNECLPVIGCASLDDVAGAGRGVLVYFHLDYEDEAWFHDPVQNSWKLYWRVPGCNIPPPFVKYESASCTSEGILYTLCYSNFEEGILTAYDIARGRQLFRDLRFNDRSSSFALCLRSYLFAIGQRKLCWLKVVPGELHYTVISITHGPVQSLNVDKSGALRDGALRDFKLASYPSCLTCDFFCLDQIKGHQGFHEENFEEE